MIKIYSKPDCPYCDRAKEWLDNNDISYQTVNIMEDSNAYDFIKSKGHRSVPQLYLGDELLVEGGYTGLVKEDPIKIKERIG